MSSPESTFTDPIAPLTRRAFLATAAAAGGAMLLGFPLRTPAQQPPAPTPLAYIRIDPNGKITLILPYVEMGQGAYTSQAQIIAEELEVDPSGVVIEAAPPQEPMYASPLFGGQITGGSGSLRGSWMTMRSAGAAARMMLVSAAAKRWQVRASSCLAADGRVLHKPSGRKLGYGELAAEAAALPVPHSPTLKRRDAYRTVGTPQRRLDTPTKINGQAIFGIDVRPRGLRYAAVAASPVIGGRLSAVDSTLAMQIPGVRQVVQIEDAVAVVADHTWAARKGLAALKITWNDGPGSTVSTKELVEAADRALAKQGIVSTSTGDIQQAEAGAAERIEAVYRLPMLAHATMEPLNCTVHLTADRCDVWLGSQILARAHQTAAEACGLPLERVAMHNQFLGGGFGRRLEVDYVAQAVRFAKQIDGPVQVLWSREEDMQHDYYRYHNHSHVKVGVDADGRPVSWRHRLVGPNIMARFLPVYQKDGVDLDVVDCASGPYDIDSVHVEFVRNEAPSGLNTGNWRGVGPSRNVYIVESVIEDLARRAGRDPVSYRVSLMKGAPRTRAVLQTLSKRPLWSSHIQQPPAGQGRRGKGLAVFHAFGSHLAMAAQVLVSPSGSVRVERVDCVVDTGLAVNPDIVRAQLEGGINFGISAVLYGRITVEGGRIQQANFDTYPILRMHEAPLIEVHIMPSDEEPGGVGEPGTSGIFAAVANAVFDATGVRVRTLPFEAQELKQGVA